MANPILSRIERLEEKQAKIPDPFVLYYKPPKYEDYIKIDEVLDNLHVRLNNLEESQ